MAKHGDVQSTIYSIDRSKDNAFYYRIPVIRDFFLRRLKAAIALVHGGGSGDVLDVGYGGGFLFPFLNERFERLYGADRHGHGTIVRDHHERRGIPVRIARADIRSLPYGDGTFDAVFCLSLLEHMTDLDRAVGELYRVLKPEGRAIIGYPPRTVLTSALFDLIGFDHERLHPMGHVEIGSALRRRFLVDRCVSLPRICRLYILCRCVKPVE